MPTDCPSDELLALHVDGCLSTKERRRIFVHLDQCTACRALAGAVLAARSRTTPSVVVDVFPSHGWRWRVDDGVGRYVLSGYLGRGGMGEVYAAWDPELERTVAIKFSRERADGDPDRQQRIVDEGRVLAVLNHPNVVRVFDAGTHQGFAYLVMERVEGPSMREWLAPGRSRAEVLALFDQVARGCVALHRAGLVHRDIKPDNILVMPNGRGLLTDFGLASLQRAPSEPTGGRRGGTPAYMAPEQAGGDEATPRSDQFSLCVTFAEALLGRRSLLASNSQRSPSVVSRIATEIDLLPAHLAAAIRRGLEEDPSRRHASVNALRLAARPPPRLRWGLRAAAVAMVVFGGFAAWPTANANDRCAWATPQSIWPEAVQSEVASGFAASGLPFAATSFERVDEAWRAFETSWEQTANTACVTQPSAAAKSCLFRQRAQAGAVIETLRSAEPTVIARIGELLVETPRPPRCLDAAASRPPSAQRTAVIEALAAAEAQRLAGRNAAALEAALDATARAAALGDPALMAEAKYETGVAVLATGTHADAIEHLESAYWSAVRADQQRVAIDSASWLIVAYRESSNFDEAQRWRRHAEAALARGATQDFLRWAQLELSVSLMYQSQGQFGEATAAAERAWDYAAQLSSPPTPLLIEVQHRLGSAQQVSADSDAARRNLEAALERQLAWAGEQHPTTARILVSLGNLHGSNFGDYRAAIAAFERAYAIADNGSAPATPLGAEAANQLANAYVGQGMLDEGTRVAERSLALHEAVYGPDHSQLFKNYVLMTRLARAKGDLAAASEWADTAMAFGSRVLGPNDGGVGVVTMVAGEIALDLEDPALAAERFETSLSIFTSLVGPNHEGLADPLTALAIARYRQGREDEARELFERSLALEARGAQRWVALVGLARIHAKHDRALAQSYASKAMATPNVDASKAASEIVELGLDAAPVADALDGVVP